MEGKVIKAISAIILGVIVYLAIWYLPYSIFAFLIFLIMAWAHLEYSNIFKTGKTVQLISGLVAGAALLIFVSPFSYAIVVFVLFGLFTFAMYEKTELKDNLNMMVYRWLGVCYISLTIPFWVWIRNMDFGRELILLGILPACLCDAFAYLFGKTIGKHKFAPRISPNKTWEGFFGALFGSLAGVMIVKAWLLPHLNYYFALLLAILIWLIAPLGDLFESFLKRSAGVKDSGSVIPGHGGILDRLDALFFVGPLVYIFAMILI